MSTPKPVPTPEAFLPGEYANGMLESFFFSCGVTALVMILNELPQEDADRIRNLLLEKWRAGWQTRFKGDMSIYNDILSDSPTTKTETLPQPEEYQLGFNRAMADAEKAARHALGMKT